MSDSVTGSQTIGCTVESCRYNADHSYCSLQKIQVEPRCDCHNGCKEDESLCGSYEAI